MSYFQTHDAFQNSSCDHSAALLSVMYLSYAHMPAAPAPPPFPCHAVWQHWLSADVRLSLAAFRWITLCKGYALALNRQHNVCPYREAGRPTTTPGNLSGPLATTPACRPAAREADEGSFITAAPPLCPCARSRHNRVPHCAWPVHTSDHLRCVFRGQSEPPPGGGGSVGGGGGHCTVTQSGCNTLEDVAVAVWRN